jgi:hypothetical protein
MTKEEFDDRIKKTLMSLDVEEHVIAEYTDDLNKFFDFYQHVPEEALEILMMEVIDEHERDSRGNSANFN